MSYMDYLQTLLVCPFDYFSTNEGCIWLMVDVIEIRERGHEAIWVWE